MKKNKKRTKPKKHSQEVVSLVEILRREGKSDEDFEVKLSRLSLEEVIALRLYLIHSPLNRRLLYGMNLWNVIPGIVKDAMILFAVSVCGNSREVSMLLGTTISKLDIYLWNRKSHISDLVRKEMIGRDLNWNKFTVQQRSDILFRRHEWYLDSSAPTLPEIPEKTVDNEQDIS